MEQGTKELVVDPEEGLCEFHRQNGGKTRLPPGSRALSGDEPLDFTRMLTITRSSRALLERADENAPIPLQDERADEPGSNTATVENRGNYPTGLIKYFDPFAGKDVEECVLKAMGVVERLRTEGSFTIDQVARRLRTNQPLVSILTKLERLTPAVKRMMSVDQNPSERLGRMTAVHLADLHPDLQERVARGYLEGRFTKSDIKVLAEDPTNRHPKAKKLK